jgi:hypothetical protein
MATIKIREIQLEIKDLTTAQSVKITGGDNPGMAPEGAYEAGVGVASGCHGIAESSRGGGGGNRDKDFWACISLM